MDKDTPPVAGLTFRTLTPSRWADLEKLFGLRGACGGCWCMAWRLSHREWVAGKGEPNRRAFQQIVAAGRKPGVLAYLGREAIGWCAVAPRRIYVALARSRVLKPVDAQEVWSVSCFFVAKTYRRQGVSVELLRAAVEFAAKQGARVIEGYPVEPGTSKTPDPFIWTGVPSVFRKAGFREVERRSPTRPIMRLDVGERRSSGRAQSHDAVDDAQDCRQY